MWSVFPFATWISVMTVLSLPLYYQQEQVWFLPTKEPKLVQIWDDYKASWPWGSLVCLHYLSLRCPCWFSPDQRSPGDSPTDKFYGCPPLCLFPSLPVSGNKNQQEGHCKTGDGIVLTLHLITSLLSSLVFSHASKYLQWLLSQILKWWKCLHLPSPPSTLSATVSVLFNSHYQSR